MSDKFLYDYLNVRFGPDPNLTPRDGTTDATVVAIRAEYDRRVKFIIEDQRQFDEDDFASDSEEYGAIQHLRNEKVDLANYLLNNNALPALLTELSRLTSALAAVTAERDELRAAFVEKGGDA